MIPKFEASIQEKKIFDNACAMLNLEPRRSGSISEILEKFDVWAGISHSFFSSTRVNMNCRYKQNPKYVITRCGFEIWFSGLIDVKTVNDRS